MPAGGSGAIKPPNRTVALRILSACPLVRAIENHHFFLPGFIFSPGEGNFIAAGQVDKFGLKCVNAMKMEQSLLIAEIEFWRNVIENRALDLSPEAMERMEQAQALAERKLDSLSVHLND